VAGYTTALRSLSVAPAAVGAALDEKGESLHRRHGNNALEISATAIHTLEPSPAREGRRVRRRWPAILHQLFSAPTAVAVRAAHGDVVIAGHRATISCGCLEGSDRPQRGHTSTSKPQRTRLCRQRPEAGRAQFAAQQPSLENSPGERLNASGAAVIGQRYVIDTFNHAVRTFSTDSDVSTLAGVVASRGPGLTSSQRDQHAVCPYPMGGALEHRAQCALCRPIPSTTSSGRST